MRLQVIGFLFGCALSALWIPATYAASNSYYVRGSDPAQPNVLILYTDDQMYWMLGLESGGVVQTPNLDRLASEGVRFTRFATNHPLCTPSRSTLLTGLYAPVHGAFTNNLRLQPENTTYLAEVFQRAGYRTGYIGKWHMDGGELVNGVPTLRFRPRDDSFVAPERRHGFEEYLGYECCQQHDLSFFWDDFVEPPELTYVPEMGWELQFQRAALNDFVTRHTASGDPWMYMVSIGTPHKPDLAPPEYLAMYDADTLPLPPWMPANLPPEKEQYAREILRIYYAMNSFIDAEVGGILADLEEAGVADNTIVVFSSDNGNFLGQHWDDIYDFALDKFQGKGIGVSNAIRVPLIVRWPGHIPAGVETDALVGMIDLPPTILSLAGLPSPWRMQGTDMSQWALEGHGPQQHLWMALTRLSQTSWAGLWTGKYMFSEGEQRHLYDLENDPYELVNLIDLPAYANIQQNLTTELFVRTLSANRAPEFPDILGAEPEAEGMLAELIQNEGSEIEVDGLPLEAILALTLGAGGPLNEDEILRDSLLSAYAQNLDAFDRNDFIAARRFRQLLAVVASGSAEVSELLQSLIGSYIGSPLAGVYTSVFCETEGACYPVDPFTPPAAFTTVARGVEEPLAGSGDADLDGHSNAEEYSNAMTVGTGIRGFVKAALDPTRDGTEVEASGACFIATAAYGTPLAKDLDTLRAFRDRWLLSSSQGAVISDAYYRISPAAAQWVSQTPTAMSVARLLIRALLMVRLSGPVLLVGIAILALLRLYFPRMLTRGAAGDSARG